MTALELIDQMLERAREYQNKEARKFLWRVSDLVLGIGDHHREKTMVEIEKNIKNKKNRKLLIEAIYSV